MPIVFSDLYNTLTSSLSFTDHPLFSAFVLGILICFIVVFVLRNDKITSNRIKLFKIFMYSTIAAICVFILQNTALTKKMQKETMPPIDTSLLMRDKISIDNAKTNQAYIPFNSNSIEVNDKPTDKPVSDKVKFIL